MRGEIDKYESECKMSHGGSQGCVYVNVPQRLVEVPHGQQGGGHGDQYLLAQV